MTMRARLSISLLKSEDVGREHIGKVLGIHGSSTGHEWRSSVSQSTATQIASIAFGQARWRTLKGACRGVRDRWHVWQLRTKRATSSRNFGQ